MSDLVLRRARTPDRDDLVDLEIREGRVRRIVPSGEAFGEVESSDLDGALLLPGLTDAHAHVDKTMWSGPWVPHAAGPRLIDKIRNGQDRRPELGIPDVNYIAALLENMVRCGAVRTRSHVDVDPLLGLDAVHAVREAAARLDGRIDVELVAFPQGGLLTAPGTEQLMAQAIEAGVEHVGGIDPAGLERDPVRHLDVVFGLAVEHGVGVDIHLHDRGSLGLFEFELIIAKTIELSMQGKVTISHGFALAEADAATASRLADQLAQAEISLTTIAPPRATLPLRELAAAGVTVGMGSDGVRDLWSPYGDGDMLERAMFAARNLGYSADPEIELALEAATTGGAKLAGVEPAGPFVGARADLTAVRARNPAEAVVMRPQRVLTVKEGRVTARAGRMA